MFFKCFLCYFVCWPQFFWGRVLILLYFIGIWKSSSGSFRHPSGKVWGWVKLYMYIHSVWKTCPYLISIAWWSFFLLFCTFFGHLSFLYLSRTSERCSVSLCGDGVSVPVDLQYHTHTLHRHIMRELCVRPQIKIPGGWPLTTRLTDDLQPISNWVQTPLLGQVLCKHSHGQCFLLLLLSENSGPMHSCLRPVQFEAQQNMIGGGGEVGGSRRWLTVGSHYVE